jgi:hypothetical protein
MLTLLIILLAVILLAVYSNQREIHKLRHTVDMLLLPAPEDDDGEPRAPSLAHYVAGLQAAVEDGLKTGDDTAVAFCGMEARKLEREVRARQPQAASWEAWATFGVAAAVAAALIAFLSR